MHCWLTVAGALHDANASATPKSHLRSNERGSIAPSRMRRISNRARTGQSNVTETRALRKTIRARRSTRTPLRETVSAESSLTWFTDAYAALGNARDGDHSRVARRTHRWPLAR
jgi:hypothetical protein